MTRSTRANLFAICLLGSCASRGSASDPRVARPRSELSFAVIAHTEIGLHPGGQTAHALQHESTATTFAWLAAALHESQLFTALGIHAVPPELLFICGNLTASGASGESWSAAEQVFDGLGLPWSAVAGASDMSLAPLFEGFDKRFGGLVYSFDRGGAHFIALCSASPCDPRPSFSPLQLDWLHEDLARNADRKPVFVFMYHAPDSKELAPAQVLDLQAAFDGHDIAAVFVGNSHENEGLPETRRVGGLDCVQCGSTSDGERGYVLASIADGELRIACRCFDTAREPRLLLVKRLRFRPRAPMTIEEPMAGAPARERDLSILVRSPSAPLSFLLDGELKPLEWRREQGAWRATLPLQPLLANGLGGAHQIAVGCDDDGAPRLCTRVFIAPSQHVQMRWRRNFAGSLRASPVLAGDRLAIASSAGEVALLEPESGELHWSAKTAAVLGTPWGCADGGVVIGNIKGWIEAFNRNGSLRWRFQTGKPVLAGLVGDDELVFAVDCAGHIHALELATGVRRWKLEDSPGALQERPILSAGRLVIRAGGGLERTLDARTGQVLATAPVAASERPLRTETAGRRAVLGDQGTVELLEAASGTLVWSWRASAQGFIFAPPLLGADGTVWIAAMDGSLSCVRAR